MSATGQEQDDEVTKQKNMALKEEEIQDEETQLPIQTQARGDKPSTTTHSKEPSSMILPTTIIISQLYHIKGIAYHHTLNIIVSKKGLSRRVGRVLCRVSRVFRRAAIVECFFFCLSILVQECKSK